MLSARAGAVVPIYLLACLLLGGSAQGIWQNAVLQLAGLAIITWSASSDSGQAPVRAARFILSLALATIAVFVLQSIPLPSAIWAHGGRRTIAEGFALLGRPSPAIPLSVSPYSSLAALFCLLPPLALFCAMVRSNAYRPAWIAAALLTGTMTGIGLGVLQVTSADAAWHWNLYSETKIGAAVGFFANANHMAILLVVCIPFAAAIVAEARGRDLQRHSALLTIVAGIVLVLMVGIAFNGSLAGFVLVVPVTLASALILLKPSIKGRRWLLLLGGAILLLSTLALAGSAIGGTKIGKDANTSVSSRGEILNKTGSAIADYMPFGSGLGTFPKVYRLYESPDSVTSVYVVHAHNDYAEAVLELGVPGAILILSFLAWWANAFWRAWNGGDGNSYARAGSIASAAILFHSLVDFPLRTAAIAVTFAMCLGLMTGGRRQAPQGANDLRPTRHLVVR